MALEFDVWSDARIKDIHGTSDSSRDLATINGIEVTDYTLKDKVRNGNKPFKKVIAQQVEKVYPQVVSQHVDFIPNVYRTASAATKTAGGTLLHFDNPHGLSLGAKRLKLLATRDNVMQQVGIVSVPSTRDVVIDVAQLNGDKVFVYGEEVNDFRTVDYEGLTTLNISATQEIAKRLAKQQADLAALVADKDARTRRTARTTGEAARRACRTGESCRRHERDARPTGGAEAQCRAGPMARRRAAPLTMPIRATWAWLLLALVAAPAAAQITVPAGAALSLGGATLNAACADMNVAGLLAIGSGQLVGARDVVVAGGGTLDGGSGVVGLSRNFAQCGTFVAGTGAVHIGDGCATSTSTFTGTASFYGFSATTAARTVARLSGGSNPVGRARAQRDRHRGCAGHDPKQQRGRCRQSRARGRRLTNHRLRRCRRQPRDGTTDRPRTRCVLSLGQGQQQQRLVPVGRSHRVSERHRIQPVSHGYECARAVHGRQYR